MFILYIGKTTDASESTQQHQPLPVRLVIKPESRKLFKRLFKLLTFQPLSANSRITFLAPKKPLNLFKFSASPGCCVIRSGLHQRVIGEAIDHVAWTAARMCEN